MNISNNCLELVKKYEGCRLKSYRCPANVWTIGYGHTGKDVTEGMLITMDKAVELLRVDLQDTARLVTATGLQFNQNQFDAVVSFVFNVGIGAFKKSTMYKRMRINVNDTAITSEFKKYVYGGGKVLKGLVKRRDEESSLYSNVS